MRAIAVKITLNYIHESNNSNWQFERRQITSYTEKQFRLYRNHKDLLSCCLDDLKKPFVNRIIFGTFEAVARRKLEIKLKRKS